MDHFVLNAGQPDAALVVSKLTRPLYDAIDLAEYLLDLRFEELAIMNGFAGSTPVEHLLTSADEAGAVPVWIITRQKA